MTLAEVADCSVRIKSFGFCGACVLSEASRPFCLFGRAASVAFDSHLEDFGVVYEPVDRRQCHDRAWED